MKRLLPLLLLTLFVGSSLAFSSPQEEKTYRLILEVDGMTETKGDLLIAIYNKEESYPKQAFKYETAPVDSLIKHVTLILPEGQYVISLFHDANGNKKLDQGEYGIPLEKYGFSNNARGQMGLPAFKDAAFLLTSDSTQYITVH